MNHINDTNSGIQKSSTLKHINSFLAKKPFYQTWGNQQVLVLILVDRWRNAGSLLLHSGNVYTSYFHSVTYCRSVLCHETSYVDYLLDHPQSVDICFTISSDLKEPLHRNHGAQMKQGTKVL